MKTQVIFASGLIATLEHEEKLRLPELQALVGGYIEIVPGISREMLVNEDGIAQRRPLNAAASAIATPHSIYGTALVLLDWALD